MATEMTRNISWEQKIGNADWTANCGAIAELMTRKGTKQNPTGPTALNWQILTLQEPGESPTGTRGKRLAFPPRDPIKERQNKTERDRPSKSDRAVNMRALRLIRVRDR
jgi:hypothetical protein